MNVKSQIVNRPRDFDIEQELSHLSPMEHAALVLHFCNELTYDGVAMRLNSRKWKIKKAIHRGLRTLRMRASRLQKREVAMKFFTIGYGGTDPGQLIEILKENRVEAVIDVRLWPHRASMGSYVLAKSPEKGIQWLLAKEGIQYHSLIELGNPFLQFDDWQDLYRQLLSSSGSLLTERLLKFPERCCLLCSEKQPADCHRSIIAEFLVERGHQVEHLIG
jgi:hypothetical protein